MDKINNITVNGVTYEIGGAGGSQITEQIYFIPDLNALETFDSTTIKEALGGVEGCEALYQAAKSGKFIVMKNDTYGGAVVLNVIFAASANVAFNWLYFTQASLRAKIKSFNFIRLSESSISVSSTLKELAYYSDIQSA